MVSRIITAVALALVCAGCSDGASVALNQLSVAPLASTSNDGNEATGSLAAPQTTGAQARIGPDRSFSSRVVAAMALERVTGRKPDPSRLAEAY